MSLFSFDKEKGSVKVFAQNSRKDSLVRRRTSLSPWIEEVLHLWVLVFFSRSLSASLNAPCDRLVNYMSRFLYSDESTRVWHIRESLDWTLVVVQYSWLFLKRASNTGYCRGKSVEHTDTLFLYLKNRFEEPHRSQGEVLSGEESRLLLRRTSLSFILCFIHNLPWHSIFIIMREV